MKADEISNEEYLIYLLKGYMIGLHGNIVCSSENDDKPSIFMEGYISGLEQSSGAMKACLRLYEAKKNGKIPACMLENVRKFTPSED